MSNLIIKRASYESSYRFYTGTNFIGGSSKFYQICHTKTGERVNQQQEEAWRQDQQKPVFQTKNFSLDAGTSKSQKWLYEAVKSDKGRHLHPSWNHQQNLENLQSHFISSSLYCLK